MSKRITSGVIAGIAAISVAVPAAGFAEGGHSHAKHQSKKACNVHRHYGGHEGLTKGRGEHRGFAKGKKCGFGGTGQTGSSESTGQTGPTGLTGETGPSGTHHHSHGHRH